MLFYNGLSVFLLVLLKSFSFLKHTTGFVAVSTSAICNRDKIRNGGANTFLQSRIPLACDESTYDKRCNVGAETATTGTANGGANTSFLQSRIALACDESKYTSAVTTSSANVNKSDEENVNSNNNDDIIDNSDSDKSAVVDDDFDTILRTRRTINSFLPTLSDDWESTLEKAIQSAIYAPNHKRTEPWRFHLLGPETIQKVCELNASIVAEKKGEKAGKQKLDRWLQMPGWLVVTCKTDNDNTSNNNMDDPTGIGREDYAACCCAVQNLCLSLHNSGMGTKWTTGPVNFDYRFNDIVGLKEDDEYVVGTIWFGTPEKKPDSPLKKQALKDVLVRSS